MRIQMMWLISKGVELTLTVPYSSACRRVLGQLEGQTPKHHRGHKLIGLLEVANSSQIGATYVSPQRVSNAGFWPFLPPL